MNQSLTDDRVQKLVNEAYWFLEKCINIVIRIYIIMAVK